MSQEGGPLDAGPGQQAAHAPALADSGAPSALAAPSSQQDYAAMPPVRQQDDAAAAPGPAGEQAPGALGPPAAAPQPLPAPQPTDEGMTGPQHAFHVRQPELTQPSGTSGGLPPQPPAGPGAEHQGHAPPAPAPATLTPNHPSTPGASRANPGGQTIWAKVGAYPWWPAKVLTPGVDVSFPADEQPPRPNAVPVRFFGTHDFAWIGSKRAMLGWDEVRGIGAWWGCGAAGVEACRSNRKGSGDARTQSSCGAATVSAGREFGACHD